MLAWKSYSLLLYPAALVTLHRFLSAPFGFLRVSAPFGFLRVSAPSSLFRFHCLLLLDYLSRVHFMVAWIREIVGCSRVRKDHVNADLWWAFSLLLAVACCRLLRLSTATPCAGLSFRCDSNDDFAEHLHMCTESTSSLKSKSTGQDKA
jgi:hypothetical protein